MRDGKLDFFKSLLIWSVVLGHCINALCPDGNSLHPILRTFDLPMFMYISGFLLRSSIERYDWKQLVLNKITNIIFPAIIWSGICFILGDRCFYYFLWAVFASSVIVTMTNAVCKNNNAKIAVLIIVAFLFHFVPKNIVNISFLFPFFIIGYFSQNISRIGFVKGFVSLIIFVLLHIFVWDGSYAIWNTGGYVLSNPTFMIKAVLLRLVIGVVGCYTVVFLFGHFYDHFNTLKVIKIFETIGKYTLSIYLIQHILVEMFLPKLIDYLGININQNIFYDYIVVPITSFGFLIIMYLIVNLLNKSEYTKWLFGIRINLNKNNH